MAIGGLGSSSTAKAYRTRKIGGVSTEITFIGDWNKVIRTLDDVPYIIKTGALLGQEAAAKKLIKIVKHHIKSNGGELGWPPLKASTQTAKNKKGYTGDSIYVMTGTYFRSIKKWKKRGVIYVGLKRGVKHPTSGLTIGQIANILEYGSQARGLPPRPLWGPSFKQLGGSKKIRKLILWHIAAQFRMRHGISPKMTM